MMQFLEAVHRNGNPVGMLEPLLSSTKLVSSHRWNPKATNQQGQPRYPGDWTLEDDFLTWENVRAIQDSRIGRLSELIAEDLLDDQDKQRGCVIFTEFKGTIDGLKRDIHERIPEIDGVRINVEHLSGDVDLLQAKMVLQRCERMSFRSNRFPILICTPAGEVGLDMEWATTLVHWDLNTNPQRLEQRTWRLDRRISKDTTKTEYRVAHMPLNDVPHMVRIENRVNENFERAAIALGLPEREGGAYIPQGDEFVTIEPGGSNHHSHLLDAEIRRFDSLLHDNEGDAGQWGGGDTWPGLRLKEAERLRTAALLVLTGFEDDATTILETGRTSVIEPWNQELSIDGRRSNVIRDMENVATAIARDLSPSLPPTTEPHQFRCSWEVRDDEGMAALSSGKSAMRGLFGPLTENWLSNNALPVIKISNGAWKGRLIVAINLGIANLHTVNKSGMDDRGLRIICPDLEEYLNPSEEEGWDLINRCTQSLINGEVEEFDSAWMDDVVHDARGQRGVAERIEILSRRRDAGNAIITAIRNQIEEHGEEDERHPKRLQSIAAVERINGTRNSLITILSNLPHELTPVAILEGTA